MVFVSLCLGIGSLAYGLFLIVVYGLFSTQNYIWLIFALAFFFIAYMTRNYILYPKKVRLWTIVAMHVVYMLGMVIFFVTQLLVFLSLPATEEKSLDFLVVLGAEFEADGNPSSNLQHRLDKAILYLIQNEQTMVVVSGDVKEEGESSIAEKMATYLMHYGIERERILIEVQADNTLEGILYSKALLEQWRGENTREEKVGIGTEAGPVLVAESRPKRVGILTNNFHLFRVMAIAKKVYDDDVYPIVAGADKKIYLHMAVQEMFMILKDKFMGYY